MHTKSFGEKKSSKSCQMDGFLTRQGRRFGCDEKYEFLTTLKTRLVQNLSKSRPILRLCQKFVKWQENPWQIKICQIDDPN